MKREVRLLETKSLDSLILAIEHFNRPTDRGRVEVVLILLDHAFELLLKAAILHKGGRIRETKAKETIGFEKCVRKCLSEPGIQCLSNEEALVIQLINSLRDAAQHYLLDISEQQLYLYSRAGVTLYGDIQARVFGVDLKTQLPARVLPVTTNPPQSLTALIDSEFEEVKQFLKPGSRRRVHARAKLRSLAIIESSLAGVRTQPTEADLNKLIGGIKRGTKWQGLFPGVATLHLDTEGTGLAVTIRLTKSEGEPVRLVPEGTPGATIVAVRKIDKLGFYNLGLKDISEKCGLTQPKMLEVIRHLRIQEEEELFEQFKIGKATFKRYSQKALDRIKQEFPRLDVAQIWANRKAKTGSV